MQDFGFTDLRIVNDFAAPFEAAQLEAKSAVGAGGVMRAALLFSSLPEAVGDCTLVAGTTAVGGRGLRQPVVPLREAASTILAALSSAEVAAPIPPNALNFRDDLATPLAGGNGRVALLFGSEKTGLTNDQLSYCALLLTIPLFAPEGRHLSMNLGQAVAICLYELSRQGFEGSRELPMLQSVPANSADRERLLALLLETMAVTDYARRFPANARPEIARQLGSALGNSREEAATWMGLFKAILRSIHSATASAGDGKE